VAFEGLDDDPSASDENPQCTSRCSTRRRTASLTYGGVFPTSHSGPARAAGTTVRLRRWDFPSGNHTHGRQRQHRHNRTFAAHAAGGPRRDRRRGLSGAGLGTTAYFNDTESFENNTLTAGQLDLLVDWQQTYDFGDGHQFVSAHPDHDGDGEQSIAADNDAGEIKYSDFPDDEDEDSNGRTSPSSTARPSRRFRRRTSARTPSPARRWRRSSSSPT